MVDSGHTDTAAVPGPLCSIADLTGHDLHAINRAIGMPLIAALEASNESGMYAFVWRAEQRRDGATLTFDDVMGRPFSEILEAFTTANGDVDLGVSVPTNAGSGDA